MDTKNPSSPDQPPPEMQSRLQAAVEAFLADLQSGKSPDREQLVAKAPDLAPWLDEHLRFVEMMFHAARAGEGRIPADMARRLKCPHCGNQVQIVEPRPKEVTCVNCGSSFRVDVGTTATYRRSGPAGAIGRFQVLELLGRGAFGEVYKARDSELDRFVALKVPRVDYFANSEDAHRFLREARSAAGLRHPSIVQVHEIAHERGSPYIVSDYIDGLTLADLISSGRPGFRESAELVEQLADALDYAHRQKVVHRDIKPSNILLATTQGNGGALFTAYLTDFGLARRDEGEIAVTLDGQVLGTPAYMSPEQAAGDHARIDGRSDVYSLGVVLYELLCGEIPFRGSRRMLLHQVLNDEPRPPRTLNERIPRDLETICLKAMAKEPARRYRRAADFRDDLRRYQRGDPIAARRVGRAERAWRWCRRNPMITGLVASLVLVLIAGTTVSSYLAVTERKSRIVAENAEVRATAARDETEQVAARSLIGPLNPQALGGEVLGPPEIEAVWELATAKDDFLWLRFIDVGTRDQKLALALCARSEPAMIGAIGLNLEKRGRAAALLIDRLRDTSRPTDLRARTAAVALELIEQPGPLADACTSVIREAMIEARERVAKPQSIWRDPHFWSARSNSEPKTLAAILTDTLLTGPTPPVNDKYIGKVFADVANRLNPSDAERMLSAALSRSTTNVAWHLLFAFEHLAERSDANDATRMHRDAANNTRDLVRKGAREGYAFPDTNTMIEMAMRMEPVEGAAMLTELLAAESQHTNDTRNLVNAIAKVAAPLDGTARARIASETARILLMQMRRLQADGMPGQTYVLKGLATAARDIDRADRARVFADAAGELTDALRQDRRSIDEVAGEALAEFAATLQADDVRQACAPIVEFLATALDGETHSLNLARLANIWAPLTKPADADDGKLRAAVAQKLIHLLGTTEWEDQHGYTYDKSAGTLEEVCTALSRLAAGMDLTDRQQVTLQSATTVLELLKQSGRNTNGYVYSVGEAAGAGLAALALNMSRDDAARLLIDALRHDPNDSLACASGVAALLEQLEPAKRAELWSAAVGVLLERIHVTADARMLSGLANALVRIAAQARTGDAAPACAEAAHDLVETMKRVPVDEVYHYHSRILAESVLAITSTLDRTERRQFCAAAARILLETRNERRWLVTFPDDWTSEMTLLTKQMAPHDAKTLIEQALRAQLAAQLQSLQAGIWSIRIESALADCLALYNDPKSSDIAWHLAQIICSGAYATLGGGRPYEHSRLDDILSESPSTSVEGGAEPPGRVCRLSTPQLVELLKMPTCFGTPRRLILDHLEQRYDRRFNTVWAFVRFAEEHQLGLDFTTPPVRADPAKMTLPKP